jgi:hypothetical protein
MRYLLNGPCGPLESISTPDFGEANEGADRDDWLSGEN